MGLINFLKKAGTEGLKLPLAWNGKVPASERLLFSHVSFYVAVTCVVMNAAQTWTAIAFFSICTILHMFKEVDKLKLNAQEKSLEIEDVQEQK